MLSRTATNPAPVAVQRTASPTVTLTAPPLSVFMAVRNEESDLAASLGRIFEQDYPGEFEVVLAVGTSTDNTWGVATAIAEVEPRLKVVANPAGFTPHGLNAAIAAADHDILVRVDGHAFLPTDYLRRIVALLESSGAANVGGRMLPTGSGPVSQAICLAISSPFGIGGGVFRVGGTSGPQDSVYLGAFRREALAAVGGYDEYFLRAQDWELNYRLRQAGHSIWFDPEIAVGYHPRSSWRDYARQQYRTGGWRRRVVERHEGTASVRYLAPPVAVLAIVLGLALSLAAPLTVGWLALGLAAPIGYLAAVLALGLAVGRTSPLRVRLRVPFAIGLMHVAWGTGFLLRSR
ncbi:MAG: glycosyltransferase family 2 protein [Propionibacteriales bacterium]|nr:glycosyltransferase family 2 protein [Propionibacteriales bacterium]